MKTLIIICGILIAGIAIMLWIFKCLQKAPEAIEDEKGNITGYKPLKPPLSDYSVRLHSLQTDLNLYYINLTELYTFFNFVNGSTDSNLDLDSKEIEKVINQAHITLEARDNMSGDVYDIIVLGVSSKNIIAVDNRDHNTIMWVPFSKLTTIEDQILLVNEMHNLI